MNYDRTRGGALDNLAWELQRSARCIQNHDRLSDRQIKELLERTQEALKKNQ